MLGGGFSSVGFAGSRAGAGAGAAGRLAGAAAAAGCSVLASCGSGAPAAALAAAGAAGRLFSVAAPQFAALPFPARLAARAAAFVRALAASPAPVLLCWPGCPAPAGLLPGRSWQSCGSGSWSELALAVGLAVPVVVFLPPGVQPPAGWGVWSVAVVGPFAGGWSLRPAAAQLSLF